MKVNERLKSDYPEMLVRFTLDQFLFQVKPHRKKEDWIGLESLKATTTGQSSQAKSNPSVETGRGNKVRLT